MRSVGRSLAWTNWHPGLDTTGGGKTCRWPTGSVVNHMTKRKKQTCGIHVRSQMFENKAQIWNLRILLSLQWFDQPEREHLQLKNCPVQVADEQMRKKNVDLRGCTSKPVISEQLNRKLKKKERRSRRDFNPWASLVPARCSWCN